MKYEALKSKMKRSFACDYHKSSRSRFEHIIIWAFVKVYIFNVIIFFLFTPGHVTKTSRIQYTVKRLGTEMTDR